MGPGCRISHDDFRRIKEQLETNTGTTLNESQIEQLIHEIYSHGPFIGSDKQLAVKMGGNVISTQGVQNGVEEDDEFEDEDEEYYNEGDEMLQYDETNGVTNGGGGVGDGCCEDEEEDECCEGDEGDEDDCEEEEEYENEYAED